MKLLETLAIELGTLNEYYKPHYNDVDKTPGGSVKDWFKAMKVEPKDVEGLYEKFGRSWAILPATMALYNRRTVDILTAASHWDDEWIYVCKNKEGRICFLGSSGPGIAKVGETHETHHDQTGASKGPYKVINIVHIKKGEIVSKENEEGLNVKASLAVFK